MKALRRALAVTLVATALCASRAGVASPMIRPEAAPTPAQQTFVSRLSVSFRRCVPTVRILEARRDQDRPAPAIVPMPFRPLIAQPAISPFQFRLPPPLA